MSATTINFRDLPVALKGKILPGTRESIALVAPILEILVATERHPQAAAATATSATESNGYRCRPYLDLSGAKNASETVEGRRLVRRDCYDHMLPLILDKMKTDKRLSSKARLELENLFSASSGYAN